VLRSLRIAWVVLVLVVPAAGGCGGSRGHGSALVSITATVTPAGTIRVSERIELRRDAGGALSSLSRRFWVEPAAFPLRQQVTNVQVHDGDGKPLCYRQRAYGDWVNIDLLQIPEGSPATLVIDYTIKRGLKLHGDTAIWDWDWLGQFWNVRVDRLDVAVSLPAVVQLDQVTLNAQLDYADYAGSKPVMDDGVYRWHTAGPIPPDKRLVWQLRFPRGNIVAPSGYAADLVTAAGVVLWVLVLLVVFAVALLFIPARAAIATTPVYTAIGVATAVMVLGKNALFWLHEARYRPGELDNIATEQVGFVGFVVILVGFAVVQAYFLRRGRKHAYYAQLALPIALFVPAPMYSTNPQLLLCWLLGLPLVIYWCRPAIRLHFGVGLHRLLERVTTEGEVSFDALAAALQISPVQLARILERRPGLPVVVDFDRRRVFSPSVAALQADVMICATCGAATQARGMDMVSCGHCQREYAASRKARPRNPVPVFVEAMAAVVDMFGAFFLAWSALLLVTFSVLALFDGDLIASIVIALIVALPAIPLFHVSRSLRSGKSVTGFTILCILAAPTIVPLFALVRMRRNRIKLFFGSYRPELIGKKVAAAGEVSLDELAAMLQTTVEEAAEVARYLAGNDLVDAVFDRHGRRLVARAAYCDLAAEGACKNCGGVLGVIDGRAACHFCGTPV